MNLIFERICVPVSEPSACWWLNQEENSKQKTLMAAHKKKTCEIVTQQIKLYLIS